MRTIANLEGDARRRRPWRPGRASIARSPSTTSSIRSPPATPGALVLHNYPNSLRRLPEKPEQGIYTDVAAVDILRDRERGVPRYCQFRRLLGMTAPEELRGADHRSQVARGRARRSTRTSRTSICWSARLCEAKADPGTPPGFGFSDTVFRIFILMASAPAEERPVLHHRLHARGLHARRVSSGSPTTACARCCSATARRLRPCSPMSATSSFPGAGPSDEQGADPGADRRHAGQRSGADRRSRRGSPARPPVCDPRSAAQPHADGAHSQGPEPGRQAAAVGCAARKRASGAGQAALEARLNQLAAGARRERPVRSGARALRARRRPPDAAGPLAQQAVGRLFAPDYASDAQSWEAAKVLDQAPRTLQSVSSHQMGTDRRGRQGAGACLRKKWATTRPACTAPASPCTISRPRLRACARSTPIRARGRASRPRPRRRNASSRPQQVVRQPTKAGASLAGDFVRQHAHPFAARTPPTPARRAPRWPS